MKIKKSRIWIIMNCMIVLLITVLVSCSPVGGKMQTGEKFVFPSEEEKHEGTWLIWPHSFTYGKTYRNEIEPIWIKMVDALHKGENIHIIAYNEDEKERIKDLLYNENMDLKKVDFVIASSNDVWVRDTGPMFVFGENGRMVIADFGFDGWGKKTKYEKDNIIPKIVAKEKEFEHIDISEFILEGGAIELDGSGTVMATLSSVCSKNRNKKMKIEVVESYLKKYFSVTNFIWLEGVLNQDITDAHIDAIARFAPNNTLLTVSEDDFYELYEDILSSDYEKLINAQNANKQSYRITQMPLTSKNVKGLNYKGSYLNYYVGNDVVIIPVYDDSNDAQAIRIMEDIYPNRRIVPINVTKLYKYGGMLHCITQQQPYVNV